MTIHCPFCDLPCCGDDWGGKYETAWEVLAMHVVEECRQTPRRSQLEGRCVCGWLYPEAPGYEPLATASKTAKRIAKHLRGCPTFEQRRLAHALQHGREIT